LSPNCGDSPNFGVDDLRIFKVDLKVFD